MDTSVIAAFTALLTPLGAMAGAVFWLLTRRIGRLEKENASLMGYVLTTCVERSDEMEKLADIIVSSRTKESE